ncbi:Peptidoglycan-recognition protein LF [Pseudolycoriella hygida]|uniref:Peptidoglycan-recognition protein LF n=1 Tax=Pseudolycoriella hygida TaxID=35572 RepID=A0A9Q0MHY4_9DIPT|nr:Peptidoglycan-recognition protein LF [Pseudolycoriella hygida]
MSIEVPDGHIDFIRIDPNHRINTKNNATTTCSECTPLLGRRPVRNRSRINCALFSLGILLIGGITVASYLLAHDNRPFSVKLSFDMVDRIVWDSSKLSVGPRLISSNVRYIYIMQTNGGDCHYNDDCVAVVQSMQMTAIRTENTSLPYNFLIGGDGETYEVRGWSEQNGFSFLPHNSSLTIGLIGKYLIFHTMIDVETNCLKGSFNNHPPPNGQLTEAFALISESLRRHKMTENYQIFGIRNVSVFAANSEALMKSLSLWDRWNSTVNVT